MTFKNIQEAVRFSGEKIAITAALAGATLSINDWSWQFAETIHSVTNLAVRITARDASLCFSGDGMFTDASRALYRSSGLVIHEAYSFRELPLHTNIQRLIAAAGQDRLARIAFVHVQRTVRAQPQAITEIVHESAGQFSLPEPGAVYDL
jgi:ribonuclease BN (tRNA processing enzyme)